MPHVKSNFAPHRDKFGNMLIEEGLSCPAEGYLHNNGFNGLHTLTGAKICKTMNLDLDNGEPIGRMHDGELWFRVNVKDRNEPFKIAVNGYGSASYDWDISIDGADPVRKTGSKSTTPISLPMSVGKHYVKITPHNFLTAGWARCLGNSNITNYWNNNKNQLEFGLEWLPGYAFMKSETSVGNEFLYSAWNNCTSLTSMPNGFNIPQGITSVGNNFFNATWNNCTSLTSMPNGFNIPQGITSAGNNFLSHTWHNCTSLTSMPNGFNIPQGITSAGHNFLNAAWYNCTSLTSNSPAEPINFPNISGYNYINECFGGSCPIVPHSPTPGSSVMVRRNF